MVADKGQHMRMVDSADGTRIAVYEVTADVAEGAVAEKPGAAPERTVSLFYPWASPIYNEYGFSGTTAASRRAS